MKVAIVYDRVNKWGGAERVLLVLHEMFPDAPLFTSVYSPEKSSWAEVFPKVIPSFLNKINFIRNRHEYLSLFMPFAFESLSHFGQLDNYDVVISVTSEFAKAVITKPNTLHICYCLTPTRYLWSHYDDYFRGSFFKEAAKPVIAYLRNYDRIAAQRPDVMVGISRAVCERIKKYYSRGSVLIYPPVDLEKFETLSKTNKNNKTNYKPPAINYFLVVSRLVAYKKVDLVIDAFNTLEYPLVIVGTGRDEIRLKSKSRKNIIFKGHVGDIELRNLYGSAKALIFPQEEDFGITAVEAQAAGIPVIAFKKGGTLDTVIDGKTGIFFEEQNILSLTSAIKKYETLSFQKNDLAKNAQRFSKEKFKNDFLDLVEKYCKL